MSNKQHDSRDDFIHALEAGQSHKAICCGKLLLKESNILRQYSFIRKNIEKNTTVFKTLPRMRVALLSSFSIDFIHDALVALGFLNGLQIEIYQAGFAQYRQEIFDQSSGMYEFEPDVVIIALEGKHVAQGTYKNYLDLTESKLEAINRDVSDEISGFIKSFRENSGATLLIHDFSEPKFPELGILDGRSKKGQKQLINDLNNQLYQIAKQQQGVFIVNYQALVNRFGSEHWYDGRMEHYAQAPITQSMMPFLATEYLKYLRALKGLSKKCLVVDLDNTLWGGVVGEDGAEGIKLGPQYPGSAFIEFQETILNLYNRGVILAIASKNNPEDVDEVFKNNPYMVLKKENFSSFEINWHPKSESLKKISRDLNIGLEHMVFIDDSPVECEQVMEALPIVSVIHLGRQPEKFVDLLASEGLFDTINYSNEDQKRSQLYKQRAQSEELKDSCATLEGFYRNLGMTVYFKKVDASSLARAAQLTQKTNQFNLTTIRYSDTELSGRMNDPAWLLIIVRVVDKYGDNGNVGLLMAKKERNDLIIDTFLLSCRVIGRTIETAMLAFISQLAKNMNSTSLIAEVIPTLKNAPARSLYKQHDFELIEGDPEARSTWKYTVKKGVISYPDWLNIVNCVD